VALEQYARSKAEENVTAKDGDRDCRHRVIADGGHREDTLDRSYFRRYIGVISADATIGRTLPSNVDPDVPKFCAKVKTT